MSGSSSCGCSGRMSHLPLFAETCGQVSKLAAVRIRNLCNCLQQSQQVADHVHRALNHALNHETALFFNRHIDQVILCCLYGICKVCYFVASVY